MFRNDRGFGPGPTPSAYSVRSSFAMHWSSVSQVSSVEPKNTGVPREVVIERHFIGIKHSKNVSELSLPISSISHRCKRNIDPKNKKRYVKTLVFMK